MTTKKDIIKLIETIVPAYEPEPVDRERGMMGPWEARMEVAEGYDKIKPELARMLDELGTGQ